MIGMTAQRPVLSPPAKMKILLALAKNVPKAGVKPFPWCTASHENKS